MLNQKILKKTAGQWEVSTRKFATPQGPIIHDQKALEEAVNLALDTVYSKELDQAVVKAEESFRKCERLFDEGKKTVSELDEAKLRLTEAREKYNAYPHPQESFDSFANLLAVIITGSKIVQLSKCGKMLVALRTEGKEATEVKPLIVAYFNDLFNLKVDGCKYCKPYLKKVANLQRLEQTVNKKWTEKGIVSSQTKDLKVWQQVMLTILEEAFSLTVIKDNKKSSNDPFLVV